MAAAFCATLRWICRTAVTVLLALAAATPSLAELGCFEDSIRHSQEASAAAANPAVQAPLRQGDEPGAPSDPAHCAFSHCPHWVPVSPPPRAASVVAFGRQAWPPFLAIAPPQSAAPGPERPPRA